MASCPRCEASIDEGDRYCKRCGAPQTEDAADELDEYVRRQAERKGIAGSGGPNEGDGGSEVAPTEALTDREQLWRRICYVFGYGTVVIALAFVPAVGAFLLLLGGIAILPPVRRLTAKPLGSPLKREVMVGLYALFVLIGSLLLLVF